MNSERAAWGGKRAGAGRPRGVPNRKTRELQRRVEAEGCTPIDLMLHVMRQHAAAGRWAEAAALAKDIAPYVHPKLATVQATGGNADECFPARRQEIYLTGERDELSNRVCENGSSLRVEATGFEDLFPPAT